MYITIVHKNAYQNLKEFKIHSNMIFGFVKKLVLKLQKIIKYMKIHIKILLKKSLINQLTLKQNKINLIWGIKIKHNQIFY